MCLFQGTSDQSKHIGDRWQEGCIYVRICDEWLCITILYARVFRYITYNPYILHSHLMRKQTCQFDKDTFCVKGTYVAATCCSMHICSRRAMYMHGISYNMKSIMRSVHCSLIKRPPHTVGQGGTPNESASGSHSSWEDQRTMQDIAAERTQWVQ